MYILLASDTTSQHQQWSSSHTLHTAHFSAHRQSLSLVVVAVVVVDDYKRCDGCRGRVYNCRLRKPVSQLELGDHDSAVAARAWLPLVAVYYIHDCPTVTHRHVVSAFPLRAWAAESTTSRGAWRQAATSRQHEVTVVRRSAAERRPVWLCAGAVQFVHAILADIARG